MRRRGLLGAENEPTVVHTLSIVGPSDVTGTSATFNYLYDGEASQSTASWSLMSGSSYASLNQSDGTLTIFTGTTYQSVYIRCEYNGLADYKEVYCTYEGGRSTDTQTDTVVDEDTGEIITTVTEVTTNEDGSSEQIITTTIVDDNGNTVSTSETEKTTQSDGSFTGITTHYDASGNTTTQDIIDGDTEGNVSTQELKYDASGNTVVTGYEIDTSASQTGGKTFDADGVNTEFYAFDMTHGFILNMHFTIDFKNQPPNQDEGHHQILSMKRASPTPWYGFQLRQTNNNEYIQLGTQFSSGTNTNTTIQPTQTQSGLLTYEYDIEIYYDPTAESNNFICRELISDTLVMQASNVFPDIPDLKYLKVCIGFGMDTSGNPYRYSNINVINFSIKKLRNAPADPIISCHENVVTINCATSGATVYYRLNRGGGYRVYNSPFTISTDTIVQAYSMLNDEKSKIITQTCRYYNGVYEPTISCDGELVTLMCETPSADIYYRLETSGSFTLYEYPFNISATTVVYVYSELESVQSPVVSETCTYSPIILSAPEISCDGKRVTIICPTQDAIIHYRLNSEGSFSTYTAPVQITATTFVEAYTTLYSKTSSVVSMNCSYDPSHDYSADYLTFKVLTGGTITWVLNGSGVNRTIQYSKSGGAWTSITPTLGGTEIHVVEGDIVRFKGTNENYCGSNKNNYSGFGGATYKGTAYFEIEGNIMSMVYGDNFVGQTAMTANYTFQQLFKYTHAVSAENLVLPATTLRSNCYRALFSWCSDLVTPPKLPATTLAENCYYYMFESCAFTTAPELPAMTVVKGAYYYMFTNCANLNYIKCLATSISATSATTGWVSGVAASGTFVKSSNMSGWGRGNNGIPSSWVIQNDSAVFAPVISYDGFDSVSITCETSGATIYYRLGTSGNYSVYNNTITISASTWVESYSTKNGNTSTITSLMCVYVGGDILSYSNRDLEYWNYNGLQITPPYSVNAVDGHSASYAKGTFNFETNFALREAQPTYLWFQHADQSATVYIDNTLVEKHWGGYNAFFVDVSNYVHSGTNNVLVVLKNNEGSNLAPAAGDFNFNATLGYVKLFTSNYLPDTSYGYDGMHITSDVTDSAATIYVKTRVPSGTVVSCYMDDGGEGNFNYDDQRTSDGTEMVFSATVQNPHLWQGTVDPYLYGITLELGDGTDIYHSFTRSYGLRYYDYVYNQTIDGQPYTGFLLNGQPYALRGVCMHSDIDGKANALTDIDMANDMDVVAELGCNFLRLAHYPHPKEVYDICDMMGIIVQTEVPCVNKMQSTMPSDYYTHLEGQYRDMVNQHYNHPCIMFWCLSNETTTDDKAFAKTKIESYTSLIKSLDQERWVGYVMSHSFNNPSSYYNNPDVDWFGCNIYVGWYIDKATNDPTSQLNTRVRNIITNLHKPLAFSEYGAGGTQHCHSEDPQTTTTKGNYERHDIEYQMWLHEGHIASIRNFPQLLFTGEWQLFDIAVSNRNEGYTECYDGETTSINDNLRRLNNKGLVERDHITKKDTFYVYKAEWSQDPFVHICGKDYTRTVDRVIKCYTNDPDYDPNVGDCLTLYVNGNEVEKAVVTDHIAEFSSATYSIGDELTVNGYNSSDSFTF